MGSTPGDLRDELFALTGAFRQALQRQRRAGVWAAPAGATARPPLAAFDAPVAYVDDAPVQIDRSLTAIREQLGDCQRCKLCNTRNKIVFGVGPEPSPLMFVGEAPGADEDRLGDPFVGKAGELLDKMIEAMGWGRKDVYIANVLKCRPPNNRNPEADEVAACRPFLDAQIAAVRPRILVTLGRPAANVVLGKDAPISSLRGRFHEYRNLRVMPTFHPAYLLREPDRKRDTWSDLKQVIAELERLGIKSPRPAK
ncbi:MAG TPA: uracil-DNA glycosylase [Kofleriaceae bacterium]|nr:uracil-DNA glycosylase [Kofleriaceae bacterium]